MAKSGGSIVAARCGGDADGKARSVLGVAMDITERKQAEALNARLAAIIAAADDAIFSLSPEGIILSWNPAGTRMFGYAAEEIIGQSVRMLYPAGADAEFQERYAQVRRGEHVRHRGQAHPQGRHIPQRVDHACADPQ